MHLLDLESIKSYYDPPITVADYDEMLSFYMDAVASAFENYCNRKFQRNEYTEVYDGGTEFLWLKNTPVVSISSVRCDADCEFEDDSELDTDEYRLVSGDMGQVWGNWRYFGKGQIRAVYEGGYDPLDAEDPDNPIPHDLRMAFMRQVLHDFKRRKDVGLTSIQFKDGSINKPALTELLPQVVLVLDRYLVMNI